MKIEESAGYKKLLAAVERDEQESPRFHDYRAKLAWVIARASQYAEKTGLEASDILNTWEEKRSYWYMNYYQDCNQPNLDSDGVRVFDTTEQALESIGKAGFRCPMCNGISKSPYHCTTGLKMPKSEKICDWKVGGLFGDLGKGIHVFLKEKMLGEQIFLPIAWEDKGAQA